MQSSIVSAMAHASDDRAAARLQARLFTSLPPSLANWVIRACIASGDSCRIRLVHKNINDCYRGLMAVAVKRCGCNANVIHVCDLGY